MPSRRVRDGLVGAGIAVAVLLVAVVAVLWSISEPVRAGRSAVPVVSDAPDEPPRPVPPRDLTADETWLGDLVLDAGTVVTGDLLLRDVRAVGDDVRSGPDATVAGTLSVDATVPFDVLAEELGGGVTVRRADDAQATVVRTVEIAGRELRVTATGTVGVESGHLVVEPRSIDVGGPQALSGALAAVARRLVTIEHRIDGLPRGLVLQDVVVQDDGLRVTLRGRDVRLAE
jgi:hypothetical protein